MLFRSKQSGRSFRSRVQVGSRVGNRSLREISAPGEHGASAGGVSDLRLRFAATNPAPVQHPTVVMAPIDRCGQLAVDGRAGPVLWVGALRWPVGLRSLSARPAGTPGQHAEGLGHAQGRPSRQTDVAAGD